MKTIEDKITLTDYFAAKIIQGYLSNSIDAHQGQEPTWMMSDARLAYHSYDLAEAMIKERKERKKRKL